MGKQTQLNLRIVGIDEHVSFACRKQFTQFPALFRTNGDILQVGVGTGKSSRLRVALVVGRVHLAVLNQRLKSFDISGNNFLYLAIAQNQTYDFMIVRVFFEFFRRGFITLRLLRLLCACADFQLFKQNFSKLLGGVDVESFPGGEVYSLRELFELRIVFLGECLQRIAVHANPFALHIVQHAHQRQFHVRIERSLLVA